MSSTLHRWIRLWSRLSGRRLRREVDDELDFHLEMLMRRFEAQGMDPGAARRAAEERFGDGTRMRRQAYRAEGSRVRRRKGEMYMDNLRQDLRFTVRQMWRRPLFSLIALAMLALGIGANTAIFSVVYTVLLKPLPFPEADRLLRVWESRQDQGWDRAEVAPANFWDFRAMNHTFEALGAFRYSSANLTGGEVTERLSVGRVSAGFFGQVLKVRPLLGRTFLEGEDQAVNETRIALLGNRFWKTHFGEDPGVLGRRMTLDGESYRVVGVLPAGKPWLDYCDVYVPMVQSPDDPRASFEIAVVGRLRPGTTVQAGHDDLESVALRLEESFPDALKGIGITVGPSSEWTADDQTRQALWILLGAVGFLLMIACVNLANLFLARASGRVRETAIRAATGASRGRLTRQGLTESLFVSLLGAGLGLCLAMWGVKAIVALAPGQIEGPDRTMPLNWWVLAFTLGAGVLTGVATGLAPVLLASGGDAASTLRAGGQSIAGNRSQERLRSILVAAEVALSLILLVGAGLLVRSFGALMSAERGFDTENRLFVSVNTPPNRTAGEGLTFNRLLLERVRALPPVVSAALVSIRPLAGGSTSLGFARPDEPAHEGNTPEASWRLISPGYFETLGVPILRGRDFTDDDLAFRDDAPLPVLISQRVAELLWPGEDPVGRTITLWSGPGERPGEVLGVVGDMRERGIDQGPTFAVYLPYASPDWAPDLVVHTAGEPLAIVATLQSIVKELDPNVPISDIATLQDMVGRSVASQRFTMVLVGLFASLALLLALAGVFGVQSYSVARRTSEIGVRVAMGASRTQIVRGVVLQVMRPTLVGVVVGLGGAWALSRFMAGLLFQVGATDPTTYAGVGATLVGAALLAAWVPARKAARVDPVVAFRVE